MGAMNSNTKRYLLTIIVFVAGFAAYFGIRPLFPHYWPFLLLGIVLLMGIAVSAIRTFK